MSQFSAEPVLCVGEGVGDQLQLDLNVVSQMAEPEGDFFLFRESLESLLQSFPVVFAKSDFHKEDSFDQPAQGQGHAVEDQLRQGHVLVVEVNAVPCGQLYFEGIVLGTAGAAAHMVDKGSGAVDVLIAIDLCPVSHIDVLQVGEVGFVEVSDFLEGGAAVDGGSGAGCEDLIRLCVVGHGPSGSPADAPAHEGVEIPGAVYEFRVVHLDHLAADGEDFF